MLLNIKSIIVDDFLKLCEKRAIGKITIQNILDESGVSRKTFYNYFRDKYDLIQYCYDTKIIPQWDYIPGDEENAMEWEMEMLRSMRKHAGFMKAACQMGGKDCLREHMVNNGRDADFKWYSAIKSEPIDDEMKKSIYYHSAAARYMVIEWILNDMPLHEEEVAEIIRKNSILYNYNKK